METKIKALRKFLKTDAPIVQSDYDDNLFIVNPHKTHRGTSPTQIVEDAAMLRAKLVTLFGPEAETWNSDFLRLQEVESDDLLPAVATAKKKLEEFAKALPMIECEQGTMGQRQHFQLCPEMLDADHSFVVETEVRDYLRPDKMKKIKRTWRPYGSISASPQILQLLHNLGVLTREYDRLYQKYQDLKGYHQLDTKIKASFDWNRLGNKHDNETAHAYQAIVNPLYFVTSREGTYAPEYQQALRDAFDGKELTDLRPEEETNDGEYRVLTNYEADEAVDLNIKDLVWAFQAKFLEDYMPMKEKDILKMQGSMCEDCNDAFLSMIGDRIGEFVEEAVKADGRGHFLSSYDGKENMVDGLFIYVQDQPWKGEE